MGLAEVGARALKAGVARQNLQKIVRQVGR